MDPKSGNRFSEKIMLKQKNQGGMTIRGKVIPLRRSRGVARLHQLRNR
jgi:hypothetical protein